MRDPVVTRETGDLLFFYRPREDRPRATSLDDVAELLVVMNPDRGSTYRLLSAPRGRFPNPHAAPDSWGEPLIVRQLCSREDLRQWLMSERLLAWTGEEPFIPPARPAGDARYGIFDVGPGSFFAFVREVPKSDGPVQQALRIVPQAYYQLWIANPRAAGAPRPAPEPLAGFSATAGARERVTPVDPAWLNTPGAMLLFVGAGVRPEDSLGVRFHPDSHRIHPPTVLAELRYPEHPIFMEPLWRGRWR